MVKIITFIADFSTQYRLRHENVKSFHPRNPSNPVQGQLRFVFTFLSMKQFARWYDSRNKWRHLAFASADDKLGWRPQRPKPYVRDTCRANGFGRALVRGRCGAKGKPTESPRHAVWALHRVKEFSPSPFSSLAGLKPRW